MAQVLRSLEYLYCTSDHPDLLIGLDPSDDAAVFRLDDNRALIVTTDFFPPIVDDAYDYGAISAANALSDIYAMGGQPLLALNIVAFPSDLSLSILTDILRGAGEKIREAKAITVGGHSIYDREPKFGMTVVGVVHPDELLSNSRARPGDVLILTKPIGTGIIAAAGRNGKATQVHLAEAVHWMSMLNNVAADVAIAFEANAATDITGFGLLGHSSEVALLSDVTLRFSLEALPFMDGVHGYISQGLFSSGSLRNWDASSSNVRFTHDASFEERMLLCDPQTSGGLLIALPACRAGAFEDEMRRRGAKSWQIGEVVAPGDKRIIVAD